MSYNVENLFDADHDTGKDDWTFLPMNTPGKFEECEKVREDYYKKTCHETDGTAEKLQIKLGHIDQVVKSSGKALPDILALVEVENAHVVEMLRQKTGHQRSLITKARTSAAWTWRCSSTRARTCAS